MTNVLLFGGQGTQKPGMISKWMHIPEVEDNFKRASDILGWHLDQFESEQSLRSTVSVQLGLLVVQSGMGAALHRLGAHFDFFAGHSLGEWSAAVVAGSLNFEDAVRLVHIRSTNMENAVGDGFGMVACIGMRQAVVERIVKELTAQGDQIWIANLNSQSQFVVSGTDAALNKFQEIVANEGAQKAVRLAVAVPAHSPLMSPAMEALEEAVKDVEVRVPSVPIVSNVSGRLLRNGKMLAQDLVHATDSPVQWDRAMSSLAERGVYNWLQVSPGNNLIGLLRNAVEDGQKWCTDNAGLEDSLLKLENE